MKERLEAMPVIGAALRIQERVGEIKGNQLATSIAFGMFLSLFPLLLAIIATVGFLAGSNPDFTDDLIDNLGLTGAAADSFRDVIANAEDSKRTASIIGVAGLLWSGLSLVGTLALVINTSWQVKGRGLVDKLSGIVWLLGGGVLLVASFGPQQPARRSAGAPHAARRAARPRRGVRSVSVDVLVPRVPPNRPFVA